MARVAFAIESETNTLRSKRVWETPSSSSWNVDLIKGMVRTLGGVD
jgi:hypothetical protein